MKLVYFIRPVGQRGPVKIGCSMGPLGRLETLASWSPVDLEIVATTPGDHNLERRIHGVFLDHLIRHEWFKITPRLDALVEGLAAGGQISDYIDLSAPIIKRKKTRNFSLSKRLYMSYVGRLMWAGRKADPRKWDPSDVSAIMSRWRGDFRSAPIHPADAEIARLEEVIANPQAHFLTYHERYPQYAPKPDTAEQGAA